MIRFKTNLADVFDRYEKDYLRPRGREMRVTMHRVDKVVQHLGRLPVLMPIDVEQFLKSYKTASRNRYRALLKAALRWGAEMGYVEGDLSIRTFSAERERGQRTRRMTQDEEARLRAVMGGDLVDLFTAAVDTGLRRGALLGLQVRDYVEGVFNVPADIQKHQQAQRIPLTARLGQIVERRIAGLEVTAPIFHVPNFWAAWNSCREQAGVEDLHWHDLRGEFASRLSEAGVGVETVSRLLGHSSLAMTQRYLRPRISQFDDAIKKLGV